MTEVWFGADPNQFGAWYGTIVGGGGGTLIGCFGAFIGYASPRGKARRFVLTTMALLIVFGLVQFALGLTALLSGQPYGIWYPMLLCGATMTVVLVGLAPLVWMRYAQAEQRRLDAEAIRRS